jgi:hypothetical protein
MEEPDNPDRTHTPETEHDDQADETFAPQGPSGYGEDEDEDEREESLRE